MIRVAAVGCGTHATTIIWPLLAPAGMQCVAAYSRSEARAAAATARFGIPKAYTSIDRMLDESTVDAVVVVVPPNAFAPVIQTVIARGLHVFAEKPGASSAEEADMIADAAEKQGIVAMVGYMKRFGSGYVRAKQIAEAAEFGPLTIASFKWSMGPVAGEHASLESWLFENPIHHIDLARYLCGELSGWKALLARTAGDEFAVSVTARATGGGVVSLQLSTTGSWEQHNERVELQGVGASVMVDNIDTCVSRPSLPPALVWQPNYTIPSDSTSSASTGGFLPELNAFATAVSTGGSVPSDFRSAARTLEAVGFLAQSIER